MIDSRETTAYEDGRDMGYIEGFETCKEDLMEVIKNLANQIAKYRNYSENYSKEALESIMLEAGLDRSCL
jgi:flagellar biosynthesis/type III secretory pathway protein FliH|nr:MAG TPA: cytochrome oxidase subunit [Caudoviricetes sp.]